MKFAKRIDEVIAVIQKFNQEKCTRICIDAIRNPYEAFFFKDKYSCFYLMSVNTEDEYRKLRLGNLDVEELKSLDAIEYPSKFNTDYEMF